MSTVSHGEQPAKRWRWYHGVAFYAAVQGLSFVLGRVAQRASAGSTPRIGESVVGNNDYNAFYNQLTQPVFAPPDWVFAPVWTINNVLCIWGGLRALNMPKGTSGRGAFIALQGIVWAAFAGFSALFFGQRSPINGAVDTNIGLVATVASMYVALARLRDKRVALSQSTILPWLVIASITSTLIALWNRDERYEAGPFVEPNPTWSKVRDGKGAR